MKLRLYYFMIVATKAKSRMRLSVDLLCWILPLPRARSIQPKFPEISVQNSMDRFGPTGKVSKKRVHLLRWSSFPGRTGLNFGWMDRAPNLCIQPDSAPLDDDVMILKQNITRNLRQNGGRPDSTQTFRSLRMAADRYREMYGENWRSANFRSEVAHTTFADL